MFQISSMMAHKILRVCTCTIFSAILESLRLLSFGYFSWDYCLTLLIQAFRRPKKGPLLIYPSRPLKDSKEPKTKQENNSIWRIPGHVMDIFFLLTFSYCFKGILFKFHIWLQKCYFEKLEIARMVVFSWLIRL